jgi:hypothetical protein
MINKGDALVADKEDTAGMTTVSCGRRNWR